MGAVYEKFLAELRLAGISIQKSKYYQAIFENGRLKTLNLTEALHSLKNPPTTLFQLDSLQFLNLSSNQLQPEHTGWGDLSNLLELNLSHNPISELPSSIQDLYQLETLICRETSLKSIPSWISELRHLRKLDLSHCQIREVPDFLFEMESLEELNLSFNFIESLAIERPSAPLSKLILKHNRLEIIPERLAKLERLYYLDLSDNRIKKFGPIDLSQLQYLNIRNNFLKVIPDSFGPGSRLMALLAGNNEIEGIECVPDHLQQLQALDVRYNQLTQIPESFVSSHLRLLFFDESKIHPKSASQSIWLDKVNANDQYNNYVIVM